MQNEESRTQDEPRRPCRKSLAVRLFYADHRGMEISEALTLFNKRTETINEHYFRMADHILDHYDVRYRISNPSEPIPEAETSQGESEPSEVPPRVCCVKVPGKTGRDLVTHLLGKTVPLEQFTYAEGRADGLELALTLALKISHYYGDPSFETRDRHDAAEKEPDTEAAETPVEAA